MTLAILEALHLWMDEDFPVPGRGKTRLEIQWFKRITQEWGVARLIRSVEETERDKDKNKKAVLKLLNDRFIRNPERHLTPKGIDTLDNDLKKRNLTSLGNPDKNGKQESKSCTSLVSKIAFFIAPEFFPPWDNYAKNGLKTRTGKSFGNYAAFLDAWNEQFEIEKIDIESACRKCDWAFIASNLEIPKKEMETTAFMRKVFDNVLNFENDKSRSSSKWTRKLVRR